jgi:phosphoglycolate phosphatase
MQRNIIMASFPRAKAKVESTASPPYSLPNFMNAHGLMPPRAIIFDWHGTLVDTRKTMYNAIDEMLGQLGRLDLLPRLVSPERTRAPEDAKLVQYVREHHRMPSRLRAAGRLSRTDIFEILFADDEVAKEIAHGAYTECYRQQTVSVRHLHGDERAVLSELRAAGMKTAIASNRDREFLVREFYQLDGGKWRTLFDAVVCGDDIRRRKPAPALITAAVEKLGLRCARDCWYVGDAATDVDAAREAGATSVFFNSARWEPQWLAHYFAGTHSHPHVPDVVVNNCGELLSLIERLGVESMPHYRVR